MDKYVTHYLRTDADGSTVHSFVYVDFRWAQGRARVTRAEAASLFKTWNQLIQSHHRNVTYSFVPDDVWIPEFPGFENS